MISDFQIFGSPSSKDYDVMVFVTNIPSIEDSKQLCIEYDRLLHARFLDIGWKIKKVNSNLAILKDGVVEKVHKGFFTECNNSLFYTYKFHTQLFEQKIKRAIETDVELKMMRCARFLLMYLSKTEHRNEVKKALHGNFIEKIKALENISLLNITQINKIEFIEYCKMVSFQLGQTISLMNGKEFYTKEEISNEFPMLSNMLFRIDYNLAELEKFKNIFIILSKEKFKTMKTFNEYKK